jgi:hypothetical protein
MGMSKSHLVCHQAIELLPRTYPNLAMGEQLRLLNKFPCVKLDMALKLAFRLAPPIHYLATIMVAFGANLSTFWILVANSWLQTPAGGEMVNGKFVVSDYFQAILNPFMVRSVAHMFLATLETSLFVIGGISAWYILKQRHQAFFTQSLKIVLATASAVTPLQIYVGHLSAEQVAHYQPTKLAAMEAKWETSPAGKPADLGNIWDANETWLVVMGGALFGAFPLAYGTILTALYMPILIMIFGLIFRAVAFEFREHSDRKLFWNLAFGVGSFIAALGQGFALGSVIDDFYWFRANCISLHYSHSNYHLSSGGGS